VTERVISQLLTELDGLAQSKEIILIAATNRPDILDPALMRPGRIDRLSYVPPPKQEDRVAIFNIFTEGMPLSKDVDTTKLALQMEYFTGADIESLCREAAIRALRDNIRAKTITMAHFNLALEEMHPSASKEVVESYERFEETLKQRKIGQRKTGDRGDFYT
jgi:transitional endoplasmic reticulum ATPase